MTKYYEEISFSGNIKSMNKLDISIFFNPKIFFDFFIQTQTNPVFKTFLYYFLHGSHY